MAVRSWRAWLVLTVLCSISTPVTAKDAAVPSKARKLSAAANVTSVTSATHPLVKHESRAAGSTLRIEGKGFGSAATGRVILRSAGIEEGVSLTVLSWKDQEILLQLPSITELGIDSETASALSSELTTQRPMLSITTSIELLHGEARMLEPFSVRVALATIDFDQDGVRSKEDKNDLDPSVH